jgi:putative flippase GtrA
MTIGFFIHKYLVFKTKGNHLLEYVRFVSLQLICFLLNLAMLPFIVSYFYINPVIGQTIFATIVIVLSYLWHSRITFLNRDKI